MQDIKPEILSYSDYRKYLNDIFVYRKSLEKNFTYGKWAREIGLSSISGLTMILAGQRHAGKSITNSLIVNLKFNEEESEHFCRLIKLQKQVKDNSDLVVYMMDNLKMEDQIEDENRPLQFKWQMGYVREAVKWQNFESNDHFLKNKSRFEVDAGVFADIYNQMIDEKIIVTKNTKTIVNKDYKPQALDTRYFQYLHKEFLRMIEKSYHFEAETRMLEYRLIMIDKNRVAEAKTKLNKLLNEFIQEFDMSGSNAQESDIYLTSLHLVPLTK